MPDRFWNYFARAGHEGIGIEVVAHLAPPPSQSSYNANTALSPHTSLSAKSLRTALFHLHQLTAFVRQTPRNSLEGSRAYTSNTYFVCPKVWPPKGAAGCSRHARVIFAPTLQV